MGKEVTNLKSATVFAFCCRVYSQIVFTISWFDSWSAGGFSYAVFGVLEFYAQSGICLLAEQDIHTSIIFPLHLKVVVMEGQDITYCPPLGMYLVQGFFVMV